MSNTAQSTSSILRIDLNSIANNWITLNKYSKSAECAGVLKADAYGIGMKYVAPKLVSVGCKTFFVANIEEAVELRKIIGEKCRIIELNGPTTSTISALLAFNIIPVLNSLPQIELWKNQAKKFQNNLSAVLHIDTGMNRLGLSAADLESLSKKPIDLECINIMLTMSHLACAEDPNNPKNYKQLELFQNLSGRLPKSPESIANSSGIFLTEEYHLDLVRPGAALYGINPTPNKENPMAEVITLKAKILQIRQIDSPETVGYGATFKASSQLMIATVSVGYADGYHRSLSNKGYGILGGVKVPIVGRISMDLLTVDVTNAPKELLKPEQWITLIGEEISLDQIAKSSGTIGYEILTSLGHRFHREYF